MRLTLLEIHDTDDDHVVGGQDLPFLVTDKVEGASVTQALESSLFDGLMPFNIRPSTRLGLAGHIEFLTFAFESKIKECFGIQSEKTQADINSERFYRRIYVRTVGELKAAIDDLPDDFPLIYTPDQKLGEHCNNREGLLVHSGEWAFTVPNDPKSGRDARWSLRIVGIEHPDCQNRRDETTNETTHEILPSDISTFVIHHHYDIGDQSVAVQAPLGLDLRRAAIYMQLKAEEWFGASVSVSNLGIAAALVTFYGCTHGARTEHEEFIDMYTDRAAMLGERVNLISDPSLTREGLHDFLAHHLVGCA